MYRGNSEVGKGGTAPQTFVVSNATHRRAMIERRRLLGLILFAGSATTARALSLDDEPGVAAVLSYRAARAAKCGGDELYHRQLLADAEAILNGRPIAAVEKRRQLDSVTCPLCGCRPTLGE